jgi:transketolase
MATDTVELSRRLRAHALRLVHHAHASHIGSALSLADLLAVLYGRILRVDPAHPDWPARDRFLLSKGHAATALYAVLAERGFFPLDWLEHFGEDQSPLLGHASHHVPGVEISSGSLGHGLPIAGGLALAARADGLPLRVFALLSDGELNEGSVWEAALFAAHHRLAALTAVVDVNGQQGFGRTEEVLNLEPLADKWRAFGWQVTEVDGHDHPALLRAFAPSEGDRPTVVLARTIKGKGVSFMEDQLAWHYKSPSDEQLAAALHELEADA